MTPADKRIAELLDRWLASIELHLKYAALDDAAYRQIQAWPEHDRPTRWILEIAQQKVLQLKSLSHMHSVQQDESFSEGLELMCFLANLVGVQNIKRFIPLADPAREKQLTTPTNATTPAIRTVESSPPTPPSQAMAPVNSAPAPLTQAPAVLQEIADDSATRELPVARPAAATGDHIDSTREMPRLKIPAQKPQPTRPTTPARRTHSKQNTTAKAASSAASSPQVQEIVIADAVRLLKWGREWHELADLIARMAERPGASEVRRILKTQRRAIENQLNV